jgi:ANTAR domain
MTVGSSSRGRPIGRRRRLLGSPPPTDGDRYVDVIVVTSAGLGLRPRAMSAVSANELPVDWNERLAATGTDLATRPAAICRLCVESLEVTGAGISMSTSSGHLSTLSASDDTAARVEDLQFLSGTGPCFDALSSGGPVLVSDLNDPMERFAERWPGFVDGAIEAGVHAVFAFPMRIGAIRLGVMDLYRDATGDLTSQQITAALAAAEAAAVSLPQMNAGDALADDVTQRSAYRLEVHQASGMIAVQLGTSLDDAFAQLRGYASAKGRTVNEVAADVVSRRLRFPPGD